MVSACQIKDCMINLHICSSGRRNIFRIWHMTWVMKGQIMLRSNLEKHWKLLDFAKIIDLHGPMTNKFMPFILWYVLWCCLFYLGIHFYAVLTGDAQDQKSVVLPQQVPCLISSILEAKLLYESFQYVPHSSTLSRYFIVFGLIVYTKKES